MSSTVSSIPQLLALDWGTSSLRAFLMRDGNVTETRSSAHGIQHLPLPGVPGYEKAFAEIAGLPEPEQERIADELLAHLEKRRALRSDIEAGLRSLDAGEGRELDIEQVIERGRSRNGRP